MNSTFSGTLFDAETSQFQLNPHAGTRNGKSLLRRANGRFYTPEDIGRPLARSIARYIASRGFVQTPMTAIDPFCGDGRLIAWLLEEANEHFNGQWIVTLWDNDAEAIPAASEKVAATARRLGIDVSIQAEVGNAFQLAPMRFAGYAVVITNPPWELLKPDRRELEHLDESDSKDYVLAVRALDRRLANLYPISQPLRRFAGWGTNLARVGTEVAVRLASQDGVCGAVSPSSLFADSNSEPLRQWLFETTTPIKISYFPAEARLFEFVDQPCVTFVAAKTQWNSTLELELARFRADRRVDDRTDLVLSRPELAASGYIVPVSFGALGIRLLRSLSHLPTFAELETTLGVWAGRELDETNRSRYIVGKSPHPFLKARRVRRFSRNHRTEEYVDPSVVEVPPSTRYRRLVWRDVSRSSQKRRVQATLVAPGWVTGNSLHVAYSRQENLAELTWLLGIVSSIPFEYQLRSILSTNHVSLGSVRRIRLPLPGAKSTQIEDLVMRRFRTDTAGAELEAAVARAYGLDRDAMEAMISAFPKIEENESVAVLNALS